MQLAMNITREQALQLLPPLRQYEQRQKQLADESAASLEALRQVQQVSLYIYGKEKKQDKFKS